MEINPADFEISGDLRQDSMELSSKLHYYGDLLADEDAKLSRMKLQLAQLEGETELHIRNDTSIPKLTEGLVKAKLTANETLNAKRDEIIDQEHRVATLKNAVYALNKKDSRLADLVRLECNRLYNSDSTPEATAEKVRMQLNSKRFNN